MNIVAILESNCLSGGGFNQALNALLQIKKISAEQFEISVITNIKENVEYLGKLGFRAKIYKYTLKDRMILLIKRSVLGATFINKFKINTTFENTLISAGADLVYFLMPTETPSMLERLNYIFTVWDLCHRDFCEFPEVSDYGIYRDREEIYKRFLGRASIIITESDLGRDNAIKIYGVDSKRIVPMPLSVSPFLGIDNLVTSETLKIYNIKENYFFYPAQFWAHKNHIRIIEALANLRDEGKYFNVVFAGGDKNTGKYLKKTSLKLGLNDQIKFLGFVPNEHLKALYEGCAAVIMPTYFGPTNIPPLEAWATGVPLIYSSHLKEQGGNAALFVDPDNPASLASAMKKIINSKTKNSLIKNGFKRLAYLDMKRKNAEDDFKRKLNIFSNRLKCWK